MNYRSILARAIVPQVTADAALVVVVPSEVAEQLNWRAGDEIDWQRTVGYAYVISKHSAVLGDGH